MPLTDVMDLAVSLERLAGDGELLGALMRYFLDDCPSLLGQVRSAVLEGHAAGIERTAHSLKGLAANFDAARAVAAARRLEELGRQENVAEAAAALAPLEQEFDLLSEAVRAALEQHDS